MAGRRTLSTSLSDFGELFEPEEASEPILAKGTREALLQWLTEIWQAPALAELGVEPRRRAILNGPPGVGKTTLAHHLAARLGLVMLAVRPEQIISKWVGETGENIGAMFALAARADPPVLLFLDEFDAYSRQRRKGETAADDSRNDEVNTLLQRLEQHRGFLIAATNFGEHVDQAIWRRFDFHITLQLPGPDERRRIFDRYLSPLAMSRAELEGFAEAFETASPALIRQFCENLKRDLVVGPVLELDMRRDAVIDRILATIAPHPEIGRPRLWSHGSADVAVRRLDWPLRRKGELVEASSAPAAESAKGAEVVQLKGRRNGARDD